MTAPRKWLFTAGVIAGSMVGGGAFAASTGDLPDLQNRLSEPLAGAQDPETYWGLVNHADLILRVRVGSKLTQNEDKFYKGPERHVVVLDAIKGQALLPLPEGRAQDHALTLPLGYTGHIGESWDGWELLRALEGKEALVFLRVFSSRSGRTYFEIEWFPSSVQQYSPASDAALREELRNQDRMVSEVKALLDARGFPGEEQIKAQTALLLNPSTYRVEDRFSSVSSVPAPLAALEALGEPAIPALVKLLDDRRPLPGGKVEITQRTSNTVNFLSAGEVVDVLSRVLNRVAVDAGDTKQWDYSTFGGLAAGSSPADRDRAVRGWRLLLGHSTKWRRILTLPTTH